MTARPGARGPASFSGEFLKLRSFPAVRRTLLLGLVAVTAIAAFGVFQTIRFVDIGRGDETGGLSVAEWPTVALNFGAVIPILLGAWVFGQDTAQGPRRVAFLATARRVPLALAKLAVVALVTLLAGIVCTAGALAPLLLSGASGEGATVELTRYGWLIGYWVLIGLMAAGIAAATRNMVLAVVPLLAWTVGLADLLVGRFPVLTASIDQVAKAAYRGGIAPSGPEAIAVAAQVLILTGVGVAVFARRDSA
ncbi:hypothetical protein [Leucobacter sp. M11]|uniref:hypothetical protein n=1 Tax=Leucobacter sp. M11 TaxID=2993565 RepID=UPI002D7FE8F4|nr:hypothetical protein [Leucobacter sp. M11]MEB4616199.1 hypothetical protein [Leucobacter sp. M11]